MTLSRPLNRLNSNLQASPSQGWGRTLGAFVASLFFPTQFILQLAFGPYLPIEKMLQQGLSPHGISQLLLALNALPPGILLGHILPWLLVGLGFCIITLWLGGQLGQMTARYLACRLFSASQLE